jgi:hypothetical protein
MHILKIKKNALRGLGAEKLFFFSDFNTKCLLVIHI